MKKRHVLILLMIMSVLFVGCGKEEVVTRETKEYDTITLYEDSVIDDPFDQQMVAFINLIFERNTSFEEVTSESNVKADGSFMILEEEARDSIDILEEGMEDLKDYKDSVLGDDITKKEEAYIETVEKLLEITQKVYAQVEYMAIDPIGAQSGEEALQEIGQEEQVLYRDWQKSRNDYLFTLKYNESTIEDSYKEDLKQGMTFDEEETEKK